MASFLDKGQFSIIISLEDYKSVFDIAGKVKNKQLATI